MRLILTLSYQRSFYAIKLVGVVLSLIILTVFNTPLGLVVAQTPDPPPQDPPPPATRGYEGASEATKRQLGIYFVGGDKPECNASSLPTGGGATLDGHTLPAASGGTGVEEAIDEQGRVASGGRVTFHGNAALGQEYRDYYITMRWRYATWNWNGTSAPGPEDVAFYAQAPRVLVTNPRTGKSIIAVVLEAGPAPWTGVDTNSNNTPKQGWVNPQDGTPSEYKGRVAGFPPTAIEALGAAQRYGDGSGDDLIYSWASDQTATPGPTGDSASGGGGQNNCSGGGGLGVSADGFVFPLKTTKTAIKTGTRNDAGKVGIWCYQELTNCHHHYDAADIFAPTGTTEVVAARGGTVIDVSAGPARVRIRGDDGKWYYYTHLLAGSVTVNTDDQVDAGDVIGKIGTSADAEGTAPHLHFDISPVENGFYRPGPEDGILIDPQPVLTEVFKALPE